MVNGLPAESAPSSGLRALKPGAIWGFLRRQPPSYWLVMIYLFFEYVRPQVIYESISGPPYVQIVMILGLFAFLLERRRLRLGIPEALLAVFSAVVLASAVGAYYPADAYDRLSLYFTWVVIYVLIANAVDTEDRFLLFIFTFILYSLKMSLFGTRSWAAAGFVFREWGATGAPGFFRNSGEFGIQMCIFLPIIVAFIQALGPGWPKWKRVVAWTAAGTAVTGIIASSSRGAFVGLAAVGFWMLIKSGRKIRTLVAVVIISGIAYAITPEEQKRRLSEMGEDPTSISRTTFWKNGIEMMQDNPILGIGYYNWPRYHSAYYGTPAYPHNIFVQAGAELGVVGLLAFVALLVATFVINRHTRQLAKRRGADGRFTFLMAHGLDGGMVGFVASGFFVTVLYYPFFWIGLAMTIALHTAALNAETATVPARTPYRARARAVPLAPVATAPARIRGRA